MKLVSLLSKGESKVDRPQKEVCARPQLHFVHTSGVHKIPARGAAYTLCWGFAGCCRAVARAEHIVSLRLDIPCVRETLTPHQSVSSGPSTPQTRGTRGTTPGTCLLLVSYFAASCDRARGPRLAPPLRAVSHLRFRRPMLCAARGSHQTPISSFSCGECLRRSWPAESVSLPSTSHTRLPG